MRSTGTSPSSLSSVPSRPVPTTAIQPFSHADERASAGNYTVSLGGGGPAQQIGVRPHCDHAHRAGRLHVPGTARSGGTADTDDLLFKVGDSANGSTASQVHVVGPDELSGSVTSGDFCGIPGNYTLYFTAQFSQKFAAGGTWENDVVGSEAILCQRNECRVRGLGEVPVKECGQ